MNPLIETEELLPLLAEPDLRLLDVRVDLIDRVQGRARYFAGHLPGAVFVDLETDLSDHAVEGQGRHPWPSSARFAATLGHLGVTPHTRVVVYDGDTGAFAARAWWMLRSFGHASVRVLDGGFARWLAQGWPVEVGAPAAEPLPVPDYPGSFDTSRLFTHADVQAHLAGGGLLVDARAGERFRGQVEPLDRRAGHIPGAVNRPFQHNLGDDGRFKSAQALFSEFAALLAGGTPSDMVAMCGSGVSACHHLLAMERAGLLGAKLYPGSWSGWISDLARPVALGEAG